MESKRLQDRYATTQNSQTEHHGENNRDRHHGACGGGAEGKIGRSTSGNIVPVIYRNKNYQKLMFGRYVIGPMGRKRNPPLAVSAPPIGILSGGKKVAALKPDGAVL